MNRHSVTARSPKFRARLDGGVVEACVQAEIASTDGDNDSTITDTEERIERILDDVEDAVANRFPEWGDAKPVRRCVRRVTRTWVRRVTTDRWRACPR